MALDQALFQSFKEFLIRCKECTNVQPEVPLNRGRVDIVGGRLTLAVKIRASESSIPKTKGRYIEVELHLIEIKKAGDDIIKGFGQLFWYVYLMKNRWCDRLYLYLAVDEGRVTNQEREFLAEQGFGILEISQAKIVTELEAPRMANKSLRTTTSTSRGVPNTMYDSPILKKVFKNWKKAWSPIEEILK